MEPTPEEQEHDEAVMFNVIKEQYLKENKAADDAANNSVPFIPYAGCVDYDDIGPWEMLTIQKHWNAVCLFRSEHHRDPSIYSEDPEERRLGYALGFHTLPEGPERDALRDKFKNNW